jgi:hypothetical protein
MDGMLGRRVAVVSALGVLLSACASDLGALSYGVVVQNKYYPDNCTQILAKLKFTEMRIAQLEGLSRKARQDTGGGVVAAAVYGPDLAAANGDLRLLRQAKIEKKCEEPPSPGR